MSISIDKLERLIFVKYLLTQAEKSKDLNRPLSSTTILTLHDAVECFVQLSFEQLTGEGKLNGNQILKAYVTKINEKLEGDGKPQISQAFIRRLNELRNQLKHATIFIDSKNIQNLFAETELLFADFVPVIFGLDFSNLTLVQLISNSEIKRHLTVAEEKVNNGDLQEAMFAISKAFYEIETTGTKVGEKYGGSLLSEHHPADYLIKYRSQFIGGNEPDQVLSENLSEIARDINRVRDDLNDLKKVVGLSVNLLKYSKFRSISPYVTKVFSGKTSEVSFHIPDEESKKTVTYSDDQVTFCYDFVVEVALSQNEW